MFLNKGLNKQVKTEGPVAPYFGMYLFFYKVGWFIVFNATFNNISVILWRSVLLLVEETGVPGENHSPATSHSITLSHISGVEEIVESVSDIIQLTNFIT